jgi:hypothetical protein
MVADCSCTLLQIKSTGVYPTRIQNDFQPQNLLLEKFHYTLTPRCAGARLFSAALLKKTDNCRRALKRWCIASAVSFSQVNHPLNGTSKYINTTTLYSRPRAAGSPRTQYIMITAWLATHAFALQVPKEHADSWRAAVCDLRMIKIIITNAFALSRLCIYVCLCATNGKMHFILCLSHPAIAKCP